MKQKAVNRIVIGLFGVVGVICTSSIVFGGTNSSGGGGLTNGTINNSACIDYVTSSGLTGHICSSVVVTYSGGQNTGENGNVYTIQKSQKTGGMANYTQREIYVESGEFIQYKVDFSSVTGTCRNGVIKDTLPSCVKYISSEIYGVSGNPVLSTGNGSIIQYTGFRLNGGTQGYILVTGQIIASTDDCANKTGYLNTGSFMCRNPNSKWIHSSVIAIRTGAGGPGGGSGSEVLFTKDGDKYELHPGDTGLKFTITVVNSGPNDISDIYIEDIWPGNNNCIEFSGWVGNVNSIEYLGNYKWHYKRSNGILRAGRHFTFDIYANISDNPLCTGEYINTGKLTYLEKGEEHIMYDNYEFIVVDDNGGGDVKVTIEKSVNPTHVTSGSRVIYTIKYTNEGPGKLTDYTITDNWPNQYLEFESATPSISSSGVNRSTISWTTPTLPPLEKGDSMEIEVVGIVKPR